VFGGGSVVLQKRLWRALLAMAVTYRDEFRGVRHVSGSHPSCAVDIIVEMSKSDSFATTAIERESTCHCATSDTSVRIPQLFCCARPYGAHVVRWRHLAFVILARNPLVL